MNPHIYADFHNATPAGRIRLNTAGTHSDLNRLGITLEVRMPVTLYTDDADDDAGMTVEGIVERDPEEGGWVAIVDWSKIERKRAMPTLNGVVQAAPMSTPVSFAG